MYIRLFVFFHCFHHKREPHQKAGDVFMLLLDFRGDGPSAAAPPPVVLRTSVLDFAEPKRDDAASVAETSKTKWNKPK